MAALAARDEYRPDTLLEEIGLLGGRGLAYKRDRQSCDCRDTKADKSHGVSYTDCIPFRPPTQFDTSRAPSAIMKGTSGGPIKVSADAKPVLFTIDDDPAVLRAIERDLRRRYADRYRVLRADSGITALELLSQLQLRNETVALFLC